jgi:predicted nucleic acid-binding protein
VSLYLDTSCLLKLVFSEPESPKVASLLAPESRIVVSNLGQLEASVEINGRVESGYLTRSAATRLLRALDALVGLAPYELAALPASILETARTQVVPPGKTLHCRTIDRLHLAAMHELGLGRLLTNDRIQASAAAALGFTVTTV